MNADSDNVVASPAHAGADAYQDHANDVYAWALRIVGCHHDALDVAQDVFLQWRGQCEKQTPHTPRAWLRRATTNRAIDFVRRRRRERPLSSEDEAVKARGQVMEPSDQFDHSRSLAWALDELSEMQRLVLIAKVFEEMTFAAIAGELELAVPTIKTHYLRALKALRQFWERHESEE